MTLDNLLKFLSPFIVIAIAFLLNKIFYNRPKLIVYYGHFSGHLITKESPNVAIFTHSVVIRNIGQLTATNVRLGHGKVVSNGHVLDFPEISIIPEVMYSIVDLPDGGKEIVFPTVVAKKQIVISYLYCSAEYMHFNTHVECNEGAAEIIKTIPMRESSNWKKNISYVLSFIGASTTLYFIMRIMLNI